MNSEGFEQMFKMNKNLNTPLMELGKATTEMCRRMAEQNLELMGEGFSRLSDQLIRLSHVKKPEELLSLQKDCINEDITATIEGTQKIVHTSMENMEALTKLFSHTANTVREQATKPHDKERSGK